MNFDIFDEIDLLPKYKSELINAAKVAERNVLVSPYNTLLNARVSLENLCKALIKSNHLEHVREDGSVNLTINDIFNADEVSVLSEINSKILEIAQTLPTELIVDDERMGVMDNE